MTLVNLPEASELAVWLGYPDSQTVRASLDAHLAHVKTLARSYTRGEGFEGDQCEEDLRAVVMAAAARSASNPAQAYREEVGTFSSTPSRFDGWSLVELAVLHS